MTHVSFPGPSDRVMDFILPVSVGAPAPRTSFEVQSLIPATIEDPASLESGDLDPDDAETYIGRMRPTPSPAPALPILPNSSSSTAPSRTSAGVVLGDAWPLDSHAAEEWLERSLVVGVESSAPRDYSDATLGMLRMVQAILCAAAQVAVLGLKLETPKTTTEVYDGLSSILGGDRFPLTTYATASAPQLYDVAVRRHCMSMGGVDPAADLSTMNPADIVAHVLNGHPAGVTVVDPDMGTVPALRVGPFVYSDPSIGWLATPTPAVLAGIRCLLASIGSRSIRAEHMARVSGATHEEAVPQGLIGALEDEMDEEGDPQPQTAADRRSKRPRLNDSKVDVVPPPKDELDLWVLTVGYRVLVRREEPPILVEFPVAGTRYFVLAPAPGAERGPSGPCDLARSIVAAIQTRVRTASKSPENNSIVCVREFVQDYIKSADEGRRTALRCRMHMGAASQLLTRLRAQAPDTGPVVTRKVIAQAAASSLPDDFILSLDQDNQRWIDLSVADRQGSMGDAVGDFRFVYPSEFYFDGDARRAQLVASLADPETTAYKYGLCTSIQAASVAVPEPSCGRPFTVSLLPRELESGSLSTPAQDDASIFRLVYGTPRDAAATSGVLPRLRDCRESPLVVGGDHTAPLTVNSTASPDFLSLIESVQSIEGLVETLELFGESSDSSVRLSAADALTHATFKQRKRHAANARFLCDMTLETQGRITTGAGVMNTFGNTSSGKTSAIAEMTILLGDTGDVKNQSYASGKRMGLRPGSIALVEDGDTIGGRDGNEHNQPKVEGATETSSTITERRVVMVKNPDGTMQMRGYVTSTGTAINTANVPPCSATPETGAAMRARGMSYWLMSCGFNELKAAHASKLEDDIELATKSADITDSVERVQAMACTLVGLLLLSDRLRALPPMSGGDLISGAIRDMQNSDAELQPLPSASDAPQGQALLYAGAYLGRKESVTDGMTEASIVAWPEIRRLGSCVDRKGANELSTAFRMAESHYKSVIRSRAVRSLCGAFDVGIQRVIRRHMSACSAGFDDGAVGLMHMTRIACALIFIRYASFPESRPRATSPTVRLRDEVRTMVGAPRSRTTRDTYAAIHRGVAVGVMRSLALCARRIGRVSDASDVEDERRSALRRFNMRALIDGAVEAEPFLDAADVEGGGEPPALACPGAFFAGAAVRAASQPSFELSRIVTINWLVSAHLGLIATVPDATDALIEEECIVARVQSISSARSAEWREGAALRAATATRDLLDGSVIKSARFENTDDGRVVYSGIGTPFKDGEVDRATANIVAGLPDLPSPAAAVEKLVEAVLRGEPVTDDTVKAMVSGVVTVARGAARSMADHHTARVAYVATTISKGNVSPDTNAADIATFLVSAATIQTACVTLSAVFAAARRVVARFRAFRAVLKRTPASDDIDLMDVALPSISQGSHPANEVEPEPITRVFALGSAVAAALAKLPNVPAPEFRDLFDRLVATSAATRDFFASTTAEGRLVVRDIHVKSFWPGRILDDVHEFVVSRRIRPAGVAAGTSMHDSVAPGLHMPHAAVGEAAATTAGAYLVADRLEFLRKTLASVNNCSIHFDRDYRPVVHGAVGLASDVRAALAPGTDASSDAVNAAAADLVQAQVNQLELDQSVHVQQAIAARTTVTTARYNLEMEIVGSAVELIEDRAADLVNPGGSRLDAARTLLRVCAEGEGNVDDPQSRASMAAMSVPTGVSHFARDNTSGSGAVGRLFDAGVLKASDATSTYALASAEHARVSFDPKSNGGTAIPYSRLESIDISKKDSWYTTSPSTKAINLPLSSVFIPMPWRRKAMAVYTAPLYPGGNVHWAPTHMLDDRLDPISIPRMPEGVPGIPGSSGATLQVARSTVKRAVEGTSPVVQEIVKGMTVSTAMAAVTGEAGGMNSAALRRVARDLKSGLNPTD